MTTPVVIEALNEQQNTDEMSTETDMQQEKEIYLDTLAADEVAQKRGVKQQPDDAVLRRHVVWDNKSLIDLKQRKQKQMALSERQHVEVMRANAEEAQRQEQEKAMLRRKTNLLVAQAQQQQMIEKRLLSRRAKMQEERAEQKAEDERFQTEDRLHQRKAQQSDKLRKFQIPKDIVRENLAMMKKEREKNICIKEEHVLRTSEAAQEVKRQERQKDEEERKTAAHKSISAHREQKIQEKEQLKMEETQISQAWLQIHKERDRLHLKEETIKKQRARDAKAKVDKLNVALVAEKQVQLQRQIQNEYEAAVLNSQLIAERERSHQLYIEKEMYKLKSTSILPPVKTGRREVPDCITASSGEALPKLSTTQTKFVKLCQEKNKLHISYTELEEVNLRSVPLPPILPTAAAPSHRAYSIRQSSVHHLPPI